LTYSTDMIEVYYSGS